MDYENVTDSDLEELAESAINSTDIKTLDLIRGIQIQRNKAVQKEATKNLLQE